MSTPRLASTSLVIVALALLLSGHPAFAKGDELSELAVAVGPATAPPNLLLNSQYTANLSSWSYATGTFQWTPTDAGGDPRSGTALGASSGPANAGYSISQCVPVTAGKTYVLTAAAFIPSGGPSSTSALVVIYYYANASCSGGSSATNIGVMSDVGAWRSVTTFATAPPGTLSAQPSLAISGGLPTATARAYFDRPSFREGNCAPTAVFHCLSGERFRVNASWKTADGTTGNARTVPFTNDSGSFWFFDASNLELNVKVLDGCALNGRYWVFASGGTNVEVTLRVTDTRTGATKTYHNPQGRLFATVADTSAFATCP